jgi:hypothetical protein
MYKRIYDGSCLPRALPCHRVCVCVCVIAAIIVGKLLKISSLFLRLFSFRALSLFWVQVFFPTVCSQAQRAFFPERETQRFIALRTTGHLLPNI